MTDISYQKCLNEMYGLGRFGIKLGMETISGILNELGSPEKKFKSIHIAGTNGKGSIASYIASILCAAGFKTGLYTSPHLVRFNERFVINNCEVSDNDVVEAYLAVKNADNGARKATFFELATAMGFYLFGREEVEWAVIETGMGGRLDATNVLQPKVSVISNLSIEHTMYLGDTIEKIAKEKGGIIKQNTPVVTGVRQLSALSVLNKIAEKKSAPLYLYGRDFSTNTVASHTVPTGKGETAMHTDSSHEADNLFDYNGINNKWTKIQTKLKGEHQIENAAIALAAMEMVLMDCQQLETCVKKGLVAAEWPGRLEYIMKNPTIILDGAHNLEAAKNLGKYLKNNIKKSALTIIIGILDDKPYEAMLKHIIENPKRIIFTKADIERSLAPSVLKECAMKFTDAEMITINRVADAVDFAIENSSKSDVICVAGSLYVAGEARSKIQKKYFT